MNTAHFFFYVFFINILKNLFFSFQDFSIFVGFSQGALYFFDEL